MYRLSATALHFPPVDQATPEGLLAVGGDLRPERLIEAYRHGIFPWSNEDQPILWWSPDPRAVLFPSRLHVPRSLEKTLRRGTFTFTLDTCFRDVMIGCAGPRVQYPEGGTWITPAMIEAYTELHQLGYAHSIETWQDGRLVRLVRQLQAWDFQLIDCQQSSPHVRRFGAQEIPRREFIARLAAALAVPDRRGRWRVDQP
jgi:leucyl/phenylalanyl-tRNA---protein transferase